MIKVIYSNKDATIYDLYPELNTGLDEILELSKYINGSLIYSSRILIKFDYSQVQSLINSNTININNFSASLKLYSVQDYETPVDYKVSCYPISQSWDMGIGKYAYNPQITDGVSWKYRTSDTGSNWTGSLIYNQNVGGGTWNSNYECTQSFEYNPEFTDISIDITPIIKAYITGSIENNGLILKLSGSLESNNTPITTQYFSNETGTIYFPRIFISYDDTVYNTGSLSIIQLSQQTSLNLKNIKSEYYRNSVEKLRVYARPMYPTRTFSTSSYYNVNFALPSASYYQVEDFYSGDVIIPFSDHTKLSCDSISSYFNFEFNSLVVNRLYRFCFKLQDSEQIKYYKFDNAFKII